MNVKRNFRFAKADYKDSFDEGDFLYATLLSLNGGTIRIKIVFANSSGGFGAETATTIADEMQ